MHAIKIEDLKIEKNKADLMIETFREILDDLGFQYDRIEKVECRKRDGFIPYFHNKGGLMGRAFIDNASLVGMGYDYGDDILSKWHNSMIDSYKEDHSGKFKYLEKYRNSDKEKTNLYYKVEEHFYNYIDDYESDYSTTMFEVRFMVLDDETIDVDVFGCTNDAPYFRSSDYNEHKNFKFKDAENFKNEVMQFLDNCECVDIINECY